MQKFWGIPHGRNVKPKLDAGGVGDHVGGMTTRRDFLALACAPLVAPLAVGAPSASEIERLEEDFFRASTALRDYRHAKGFVPGARVRTVGTFRGDMDGVISPFGSAWAFCSAMNVPVRLDNGDLQPWAMSQLIALA